MNTKEKTEFIKTMESYASRLAVSNDLRTLFKNVDIIINEIVEYQYMVLYYYNPHTHRLKAVSSKGLTKTERSTAEKTAMKRAPGKAWLTKEIIYVADEDEESIQLSYQFATPTFLKSRLHIPLIQDNNCIGVFSLASIKANQFNPEIISMLSFITNIAAAIYKSIVETRDLQRINKRLEEINKNFLSQKLQSIGQLAAGLAHELNTPLQYIGDNVSFLNNAFEMVSLFTESVKQLINEEHNLSKEQIVQNINKSISETDVNFFLDEIPPAVCQSIDGIEKLNKIIKTIKDFSQLGIREKSFKNLNKSIEDTVLITRNEWKTIAELNLNLAEDLPLIFCLKDEINQVLLQLLLNSIQAVQEKIALDKNYKRGRIVISTCYDNDGIDIMISDDGIGIQEKHLDKIFDPFFTTKEIGKGTGQGLTIAHDVICHKHSGDIFVRSNYLKGSEFLIKLPFS